MKGKYLLVFVIFLALFSGCERDGSTEWFPVVMIEEELEETMQNLKQFNEVFLDDMKMVRDCASMLKEMVVLNRIGFRAKLNKLMPNMNTDTLEDLELDMETYLEIYGGIAYALDSISSRYVPSGTTTNEPLE